MKDMNIRLDWVDRLWKVKNVAFKFLSVDLAGIP